MTSMYNVYSAVETFYNKNRVKLQYFIKHDATLKQKNFEFFLLKKNLLTQNNTIFKY